MKKLLLILVLVLLVAPAVQAAMVPVSPSDWTGSRGTGTKSDPYDDTVIATGNWGDAGNGFKIAWVITQDSPSGLFHYQYTLSGADGTALSSAMSHWMLQVSDGAVVADFSAWNPAPTDKGIGTWTPGPDNPEMGGNIYGIRWEKVDWGDTQGYPADGSLVYIFKFDTNRQPIWGDFYARCGRQPEPPRPWNTAQSFGLYYDIKPGDVGWSEVYSIPVPDSQVPLPPSAILLGSGLLGMGLLGWRRRGRS